jgi:hypothetical protein
MTSRKKSILFVFALFLFAGVIWILIYNNPSSEGGKMPKSVVFISKNPTLDFIFEYPATGWSSDESQGRTEKYDAVRLKGPVDEERRFGTLIEIVVKPLAATGTYLESLEALLKRVSAWPKFKMVSKTEMKIGGEKAFSAIYESEERLPMEDLNAKPVTIKRWTLFLAKDDKIYRFSFHVLAEQWKDYAAAFKQVLETFKFKE